MLVRKASVWEDDRQFAFSVFFIFIVRNMKNAAISIPLKSEMIMTALRPFISNAFSRGTIKARAHAKAHALERSSPSMLRKIVKMSVRNQRMAVSAVSKSTQGNR